MKLKQLSIIVVAESKDLEWIYEFLLAHGEPAQGGLLQLGTLIARYVMAVAAVAEPPQAPGSAKPDLN